MHQTKYIVILGSIMSGLGKGILTASIGKILKERGFNVLPIKFDGYLNYDCGTMNPFRHGEVFVLEDGSEVDMDFGTYERFLNMNLTGKASLTGGKVFKTIIEKERKGEYLGRDVQFIPHVTDFIKTYIQDYGKGVDFVIIEVGGTVGDIENNYFIEAMRQLSLNNDVMFIQLTYLPQLRDEQKTKPTQQANKLIMSMGIKPHMIVARTSEKLKKETIDKIALYTNVDVKNVISDPDVNIVYKLPLILEKQHVFDIIADYFNIVAKKKPNFSQWEKKINRWENGIVKQIGIVGKYVMKDAYVSIFEALKHGGMDLGIKPNIEIVDAEQLNNLDKYDGLIIAGGFGKRGIEGKIKAINYARIHKTPLLGLCLGLQLMIVEYARNVLGWKDANSTEFDPNTTHPVIDLLPEQKRIIEKGATMRLGCYPMDIKTGTLLHSIYEKTRVCERHRHRYEVNPDYVNDLEKAGLVISATYKHVVEAIEYKNGLGIGLQSHPELSSKVEEPSPIFKYFLSKI